jgi:hypothetical protein
MDRLVRMFHSGFVKENGEFENMNELVESFNDRSTYKDLFDRVMQKYGCGLDELTLRYRFDCGKARPHFVKMNLSLEEDWKHYKEVVGQANVSCLEVVVDISRRPSLQLCRSGTFSLEQQNPPSLCPFPFQMTQANTLRTIIILTEITKWIPILHKSKVKVRTSQQHLLSSTILSMHQLWYHLILHHQPHFDFGT